LKRGERGIGRPRARGLSRRSSTSSASGSGNRALGHPLDRRQKRVCPQQGGRSALPSAMRKRQASFSIGVPRAKRVRSRSRLRLRVTSSNNYILVMTEDAIDL
jgi:hypothetical protein